MRKCMVCNGVGAIWEGDRDSFTGAKEMYHCKYCDGLGVLWDEPKPPDEHKKEDKEE
jgi:hypothetical protein